MVGLSVIPHTDTDLQGTKAIGAPACVCSREQKQNHFQEEETSTIEDEQMCRTLTSDGDNEEVSGGDDDTFSMVSGEWSAFSEEADHHFDDDTVEFSRSPRTLGRARSQQDLLVSSEAVEHQFLRWRDSLAEITAQPLAVLDELLIAHVREHGWDTGEHLIQVLLSCNEGDDASAACNKLYSLARLRPPSDGQAHTVSDGDTTSIRCVVCTEEGGNFLKVSDICGHWLHENCLAAGLRTQLRDAGASCLAGAAHSLRCPACTVQSGALVAANIASAVLAEASAPQDPNETNETLSVKEVSWLQVGSGTLLSTCPEGMCHVKPGRANYSMQVVCDCDAAHRFCCYCGQAPHEPVPCAQMLEFRSFLDDVRRDIQELKVQQQDIYHGSEADRAALLSDMEQAQEVHEDEALKLLHLESFRDSLVKRSLPSAPSRVQNLSLESLHEEYDTLLGSMPSGALGRSSQTSLALLRGWRLEPSVKASSSAGSSPKNSLSAEEVDSAPNADAHHLEATTRPCPRCFIAIEKEGGCQHMTCNNPRCRHDFCWLCLRDWRNQSHDALHCALLHSDREAQKKSGNGQKSSASDSEVLQAVEARIRENWEAQPVHTRPPRQEDYAEEVRKRFNVALTTTLESDRELLMPPLLDEPGNGLHLSLRLMQLYERRERQAREAARVAFGEAVVGGSWDADLRHQAVEYLRTFISWLHARWWLRLLPEDASATPGHAIPELRDVILPSRGAFRVLRSRAEHAAQCMQQRELGQARMRMRKSATQRFLTQFAVGMPNDADVHASKLLASIFDELEHDNASGSHVASLGLSADRALSLASAATCAWHAGQLFELVGVLQPILGDESKRVAMAAAQWVQEVQEKSRDMRTLLKSMNSNRVEKLDSSPDQIARATSLLDVARRSLFQLSLEYCGGTRRNVRRRGEQ